MSLAALPPVSPGFRWSFSFRTIDTLMGGLTWVNRVSRNPYLFLSISRSIPRMSEDVHRSSPSRGDELALLDDAEGPGDGAK